MSTFRAGAARNVITPEIGCRIAGYYEERIAVDIHDDLYAKAIVLESTDTLIAIAECDLIGIRRELADQVKAMASEMTGIPAENILVGATHTHFGPTLARGENKVHGVDYVDWLPGRIADAIKMAQNRLRPAAVAHASGSCPEECHNRRYVMKDGSIVTNPGYLNPDVVKPAGPTDPEVGLMLLVDEAYHPIAVVGNYALHYVGGQFGATGSLNVGASPVDTSITADYFGVFDRSLQRMWGAEFVGIMLNGCAGDINNYDVFRPMPDYPEPWYQIQRVGDVVAAAAYKALRGIRLSEFQREPKLAALTRPFSIRRRTFSDEEVKEAQARLKGDRPKNLGDREWLIANGIVRLSRMPLVRETLVQAFRIGDLGLVGLPGEIFVEIGLEIKKRSPFRRTLITELANDATGYMPSPTAFDQGSYEVYGTACSRETGPELIATVSQMLQTLAT